MGGGIENSNEQPIRIIATENGGETTGQGTSTTSTSTTDSTASSGGNGGRGRGRGTGGNSTESADTSSTGKETKQVSELAILTDEEKQAYELADANEQKRILRNAKRRERYAKQKAEGTTPKPKKVNKKTKTEEIDRTQINAVISGLSSAIASRPNCGHWQMTNEEIDTITKPLCNMLKESEIFEKTLEHSNEIALVTACATVFLPRIFTTVLIEKEKNKNAKPTRKTTENKGTTKQNDSGNAPDTKDSGNNDLWLGNALY